jgi:SMI1 / KNR4 family (SUKH-1)
MKAKDFDQFLSEFCRALPYGMGPASDVQIDRLKSVIGHSIPTELEKIVRTYGNTGFEGLATFDNGKDFKSLSSIFNVSDEEDGFGMIEEYVSRPEYRELGFLPFANDGAGGTFFWCVNDDNVLHVNFGDWDQEYIANRICDSFSDFISRIEFEMD